MYRAGAREEKSRTSSRNPASWFPFCVRGFLRLAASASLGCVDLASQTTSHVPQHVS